MGKSANGTIEKFKISQNEQSGMWQLETKYVMKKAQGDGLSFKRQKWRIEEIINKKMKII